MAQSVGFELLSDMENVFTEITLQTGGRKSQQCV